MWRRRSPSVMIPASLPSAPVMPTQPKPFAVITTIASGIEAPSAISGTRFAGVHDVADEFQLRAEPAARMEVAEIAAP